MKYEKREVFLERGIATELPPAQPNFSMRGRTVNSLLKAVDSWHKELGKIAKGGKYAWKKSPIQEYKFTEGRKETKNMKIWRIEELLSSKELIEEGRQMKHCVATYAGSCKSGKCSIWKMELETENGKEKRLTIEVGSDMIIKQIRGKCNRLAQEKELAIIRSWTSMEGLSIASYI
jgi:hypothetical protein